MGEAPAATAAGCGARPRRPPAPAGAPVIALAGRLYWLWPSLLTLALAGFRLGRPALWADELATWGAVRLSWPGLFRLLGHVDAVIGPYYVVEKAWTELAGTSTIALRLPSVVAMAASALLVSVLGAACCAAPGRPGPASRWGGLLAGLAFAVVPATSRYAQEARPYALAVLCAVLATLLLVRLMQRPVAGRAAGYAGAILLLGAFHLAALLLLAGHAVAVLASGWHRDGTGGPAPRGAPARDRYRDVLTWAVASTAAVLPVLPLAWLGRRQRGQISWIRPVHWRNLVDTPGVLFGSGTVSGALLALAAFALLIRARSGRAAPHPVRPGVLLASWAVGPVLALYLAAELTPVFWARYLLYTIPATVLLAALALVRLPRLVASGVLIVIAALGVPAQRGIRTVDGHNHATSQAAGIIAAGERPGDAIVYALHEPVVPWEARDIVARYVPGDRRPADVFALAPQRTDGRLLAAECPDLTGCLDRADPPRIWVLRYQHLSQPLAGLGQPKEDLLRSRYHVDRLWLVRGLTVALLLRN